MRLRPMLIASLVATLLAGVARAETPCPRAMAREQAAIAAETSCLLARYVRLDTTNPPGHEALAAEFIRDYLAGEGIETQLVADASGRPNVIARLHGNGSARALMLVHHMDVVPAEGEWSVAPFAGTVQDGYLWGRGSLDNKGPGVMELVAFALLKRLQVPLARDVVLLGVADEEQGGGHGARFLMREQYDALFKDVEFALNEGGALLVRDDGSRLNAVEFAQKAPLWLKLTAHGKAGHASLARPDAATHRLVRALAKLEQHQFPVTVAPEVQQAFSARAQRAPAATAARYRDLERALADADFRAEFLREPHDAALVRNSLAITMLSGSGKENVYPETASAVLDLRLLPGADPAAVTAELTKLIDDPSITVDTVLSSRGHSSPLDTVFYDAIESLVARHYDGATVTPNVIAGFTDCNSFRSRGIVCYGFMPMTLPLAETARVHGRDERIKLDDLANGTVLLEELVRDVAARR